MRLSTRRGIAPFLLLIGLAAPAGAGAGLAPAFAHGGSVERSPAAPVAARAPDDAPQVRAARIPAESGVRIDGLLDDEVWALAEPIVDFRQQDPVEGGDPSVRTEIRILYDEGALYIGGMFFDDPSGILAYQRQRNAGLGTDDRFMWILDTFQDGRTGYFFEINPAGLMGDGVLGSGMMGVNKSWDGIWEVRTRILDDGWSAEIRIPFSTLNFDPALDSWGINFQRTVRRHNEEIVWSGWRRNQTLTRPVHAGRLVGLEGLSQGVGLEVKPYVVGSGNRLGGEGAPGWDRSAKAGADLSYSITPGLRGAVSVNTDFAEVEVDQRRVNLTRFPQRFPERRDFFLEGGGVFSFAPAQGADPFFSRRIGLVDGQEVPIRVGARLAGQAGAYRMGFFQVRTGESEIGSAQLPRTVPQEDFTAARVRRSFFQQSNVGLIYTRRATHAFGAAVDLDDPDPTLPESPPDRHSIGADFDLYTSSWLGRYNAQLEGFFVYHTDPLGGEGGGFADRRARGIRVNFPNDVIRFHASVRDFGTEWNPAMGFTTRRGFRRFQPTLTYAPRPERWRSVRQMQWQIAFEYLTDLDNRMLTRGFDVSLLDLNFESGDRFSIEATREFELLERSFRIHGTADDPVMILAGPYNTTSWSVGARSAGRRVLSGNVDLERADFWSGHRTQFQTGLTARPWPGISVSTNYQRNEVRLPQGEFDTNLVRLSGSWDLSPLTSFSGNLQYDDVSEVVGLFARARWIVRPGNDIFLVYTHNWRYTDELLADGRRELETLSRGGAFKVNYTYRF